MRLMSISDYFFVPKGTKFAGLSKLGFNVSSFKLKIFLSSKSSKMKTPQSIHV